MKHRIKEIVDKNSDTLAELAKALKITYQTLSKKMNGHVDFTRAEIMIMKNRYNLTPEQLDFIFFEE